MAARYIDPADLLSVLPDYLRLQLLDDNRDGTEEAGLASKIVSDAADEVDMYFAAAGYTVPIVSPPPAATVLTQRVARYIAHFRLSTVTPEIAEQYRIDREMLTAIATRRISVGSTPLPPEAEETAGAAEFVGPTRTFSRTTLVGF